jgi:predicted O-methyltransferase YrrM
MSHGDLERDLQEVVAGGRTYPLLRPSPGGWAMHAETCRFLGAFVQRLRPRRILEFGSGFSSAVIACELKRQGQGSLDSIDNSPRWSAAAAEMVRACGALERTAFHRFPLGLRVYRGFPCVFYRIPTAFWDGQAPYDLAVVDGPHQDVGRDGALPECLPWLSTGGWVILDDGGADHMQRTLRRWQRLLGSSFLASPVLELGNGVVVLRKLGPAPPRALALPPSGRLVDWLRAARNVWRLRRLGLNTAQAQDLTAGRPLLIPLKW